jgi:hypothetical protein
MDSTTRKGNPCCDQTQQGSTCLQSTGFQPFFSLVCQLPVCVSPTAKTPSSGRDLSGGLAGFRHTDMIGASPSFHRRPRVVFVWTSTATGLGSQPCHAMPAQPSSKFNIRRQSLVSYLRIDTCSQGNIAIRTVETAFGSGQHAATRVSTAQFSLCDGVTS